MFYFPHVCFELKSSLWLDFHLSAGSCPNIVPVYHFLDPGQMEDSDLNNRLIRRYGIPKSRTLTSSVFTSPIGSEHYTLFEPLSGDPHQVVQQAFGLREYDETGTSSEWLTR